MGCNNYKCPKTGALYNFPNSFKCKGAMQFIFYLTMDNFLVPNSKEKFFFDKVKNDRIMDVVSHLVRDFLIKMCKTCENKEMKCMNLQSCKHKKQSQNWYVNNLWSGLMVKL